MGKKIKKEEKGPPEDVPPGASHHPHTSRKDPFDVDFDPLLVESRQAATVVLMLASPEDEVLAKACEAIYKFVEKCDDNKKVLLDLDACDALLRLSLYDDKMVRRNACMALGVMAQHPECRKALKKREDTIPSLITLLGPEEDTVVHEFAALGLSSLANDYSSKIKITEEEGIESLVRLLGSNDPDVQKNSIETIALLLQDYKARTVLREQNGFPPMLDLIQSEYAIIQHLTLISLQRATEDALNRAALRELGAMTTFINLIGQPDINDLHVLGVVCLSNMLEDTESLELIKENKGLAKLVAYITDVVPTEEEHASKGKEKKGGSRAGKKGKDDGKKDKKGKKGKAEEDDKKKTEPAEIIPTLPEVKEWASRAIARAAKNEGNRKILHEQEVEKMLILLLTHENPNVQTAAAQALAVMSEMMLARDSIGNWEGIEPLVKLMKNDTPGVRQAGAMALAKLTTSNAHNCQELAKNKGIDPLIELLSDEAEHTVANAAIVLTNLATEENIRCMIQNAGVIPALVGPLKSQSSNIQSKAALAVAAFTGDADCRATFRECGGIEPLINLLRSGSDEVRRSASWAITVCANDEATAVEICKVGGLEMLQELSYSDSRKSAFTDVALERLLETNLPAKYALTGYLGPENIIRDSFFDPGQLKCESKFLSLEDHLVADVNQKRCILLINPRPEKSVTPVPPPSETDGTETKSSKGREKGKGGRGGLSANKEGRNARSNSPQSLSATGQKRSKSRAQREKEEKQREELQAQKEAEAAAAGLPVEPPGDSLLLKYIEEVVDRIQPLPTSRDQVVALAQFVSEKLGGQIDRGQVNNFSWELPLSQLKFEYKSNVIPIGHIKAGIHYHRALLFKVLADRIAVGCSLVRGEYNRAWNEVMLTSEDEEQPSGRRFPPKAYIVDLVHQPGRLMRSDTSEAINYQKL